MTYTNARKYLTAHSGIRSSPERMKLLCRYVDDRIRRQKCVHIAGGSGKSSCAFMISSVLKTAGIRTGTFLRTPTADIRDAVLIDGQPVSCDDLALYIGQVAAAAKAMTADIITARNGCADDGISTREKITKNLLDGKISPEPSEDEILCAAALLGFYKNSCGVTVLECGDSRTDPTGVIEPPAVALICGSNLTPEQLRTGVGIVRRGTREVISSATPGEAYSTVLNTCVRAGSRLTVPARAEVKLISRNLGGREFEYRGRTYALPCCAEYQTRNALSAIETIYALRRAGTEISGEDITAGLKRAKLPLRFELISLSPFIVADCPTTERRADAFCSSLAELSEYVGSDTVLVCPPNGDFVINGQILLQHGIHVTDTLRPASEKDLKLTASVAANLTSSQSMLILGDAQFAERVTYSVRKHLGIG